MNDTEIDPLFASSERLATFFDIDATTIETAIKDAPQPIITDLTCPVQLVKVHTFIIQGHTKDVRLGRAYLVPTFASHWGVIVGDSPSEYTLYHLVFNERRQGVNDGNTTNYKGRHREVEFDHTRWREYHEGDKVIKLTEVGGTKYSHRELVKIGKTFRSHCHYFYFVLVEGL
jgi:hypothetical protein